MRRNSQTHARRTSQCVSIPHHTTFAYEVMVMIIDRLRCRDPPTTPSYAKDGDVYRVGTIVASLDAATIRCGTIVKSSTWQRRISKHEILTMPSTVQKCEKDGVAHLAHTRGHCISFWLSVPPLQVAPSFACSVASLSRYPGH